MEKFIDTFTAFASERLSSALVETMCEEKLFDKIKTDSEEEFDEIVSRVADVEETSYKAGFKDGIILMTSLGGVR